MGDRAGSYDLSADFDEKFETFDYGSSDVHWVLAIVRLDLPLSFSRKKMTSVTTDVTQGALLRAEAPLVVTDDCLQLTISHNKRSHMGHLSATLKQTDTNYLVEVLPGDWILAWLCNNSNDFESLRERLSQGPETCNNFKDGLKFVGRVHDLRKSFSLDPERGVSSSSYTLSCVSFGELESEYFYDPLLASNDSDGSDIGRWLAKLGYDTESIFGDWSEKGISPNNINLIAMTLLDLIIGKGPPAGAAASIAVEADNGGTATQSPQVTTSAPFAYLIPAMVGSILGRDPKEASKGVFSYADILELLQGLQTYENKNNDYNVFIPDRDDGQSAPRRHITRTPMLGTFLPAMPEFANKPIWQVLQQYTNPHVNEMYTTLRVNKDGQVMPTIVFRQIPYTTEAFEQATPEKHALDDGSFGPRFEIAADEDPTIAVTKFLDLPRWKIPLVMIQSGDVGRSDATRTNMVHIYGSASNQANNVSASVQIIEAPPIRDDLDIMRSGIRPYSASVECFVNDEVGTVPGKWMRLISDWTIGSQYTLNGNLHCHGIQAPICVGDNLEFDKIVYHIDSVTHTASIDPGSGKKRWSTSFALTNGMRSDVPDGETTDAPYGGDIVKFPIYPGFEPDDGRGNDPGLTLEQRRTTGGPSIRNPNVDVDQPDPPSPFDATNQDK